MNKSRRDFLLGATFAMPSYNSFNFVLLERLSRALAKPSSLDETTLSYLEKHTENYWQDRHSAALASYDLLSYVCEHLQKVTILLEGSLYPSVHQRLCSIAGEIALLAGELLFDMSDYVHARDFYTIAIQAALEADNPTLQAVTWGRMSFAWTYSENSLHALSSIQEARRLAIGHASTTVCTWLAAVEAEIQANLSDHKACLNALREAEGIEERHYSQRESYWIHFDRSLLAGYQGICFLRLAPENAQGTFLLTEAQRALKDALALLDPSLTRRKPTLLTDLASSYLQQHEIEVVCEYATQAITLTNQIKSRVGRQRLQTLRSQLEPWKDTPYVKNLDERFVQLRLI